MEFYNKDISDKNLSHKPIAKRGWVSSLHCCTVNF